MRSAPIGADPWIAAAVNADEVKASKPAPDIFIAAMRRVDADPDPTFVLGDSTWDIEASRAARLRCIAVTCGGISAAELVDAGADAVYQTPHHLLDDIANSPLQEVFA